VLLGGRCDKAVFDGHYATLLFQVSQQLCPYGRRFGIDIDHLQTNNSGLIPFEQLCATAAGR